MKWASYFTGTGIHECFLMDFTKLFPICNLRGEEGEYSLYGGPALFLPSVGVVLKNAAFALALHIPQNSISD